MSIEIVSSLLICFLSSLFPVIASYRRMKLQFTEPSLTLFIFLTLYTLSLLTGTILHFRGLGSPDHLAIHEVNAMVGQFGISNTFDAIVIVLTIGLTMLNLLIGVIIYKTKRPIAYSIASVTVVLGVLSIPISMITSYNPLVSFFMECCGVMAYFAWLSDLTYKEFCVIGNIYIQAGMCMLAAAAPLLLCLRKKKGLSATAFCTINCMLHAILFYVICVHYWIPLDKSFDLCFRELNQLATYTGTSYVFVNIVIFIIMFVGDLIINSIIYKVINRLESIHGVISANF